ncbi:MAG TPA: LPS assembly protein LptD [Terriglobales bacterium]|nr:LPS assembly protein LptD [Terriglobales bacterium]
MIRTRFLITAGIVCHLLLTPPLVTSQLRARPPKKPASEAKAAKTPPPSTCPLKKNEDGVCAVQQEKDGPVFKLHGEVEVHYLGFILRADEASYNSDTGETEASGHVILDGGLNDEHLEATHAVYNLKTETGKFENVRGTIGLRLRQSRLVLTSSEPFSFSGKLVEKVAPDHYIVHQGTITTCEVPNPKWQFFARKVEVEAASDAKVYHSTFRIEGIPVMFLPFVTYPIERQRQSGFLIPNLGSSSIKGLIVGESVYWAVNRTMDVTLGSEYFSLRGWAPQGEFRWRPSETSFVDLRFTSVLDRGYGPNHVDQGGADVRLNAQGTLPLGFRGVADIDYLTSFVYRLAFNEIFTQAVYSEVKSQAFASRTTNGISYNIASERYQDFESSNNGDVITILHAPSVDLSAVDHPVAGSPFYWSFDASVGGLSRSEPFVAGASEAFRTADLVGRFDLSPTLALPLLVHGWSVRPELTLRNTLYTQEIDVVNGNRTAVTDPINRKALEGSVEIRPPALERVFAGEYFGRKWKHVVEPAATYRYVTGVNNFEHLLRFDALDILSDTNEVEYSVVNRLFAKRVNPPPDNCPSQGMPSSLFVGTPSPPQGSVPWGRETAEENPCTPEPQTREVLSWELAQKYFLDPTFGGALVPGQRNVFTTTADLTGIAFLTGERHLSPLISRLRLQPSNHTNAEWDLDYDFQARGINASTALVNYEFGRFTFGGGDAYLRTPLAVTGATSSSAVTRQSFNQFRLQLGYGRPNKRGFSGASSVGFDANLNFLQYAALQTTYNWGCCGFTAEYRRFALGSVRNENQFRFSLALANLGSIGNLTRRDRLF